jgi:four helix bundle protein
MIITSTSPSRVSKLHASTMNTDHFRFEDMEIWQRAVEISMPVFDIADSLEDLKKYRFAEQLRAAMLSVSNNMAEGSGSSSDVDFANFLNISRRSIFEVASMLIVFHRRAIIPKRPTSVLAELIELSKMTLAFRNTLKQRRNG